MHFWWFRPWQERAWPSLLVPSSTYEDLTPCTIRPKGSLPPVVFSRVQASWQNPINYIYSSITRVYCSTKFLGGAESVGAQLIHQKCPRKDMNASIAHLKVSKLHHVLPSNFAWRSEVFRQWIPCPTSCSRKSGWERLTPVSSSSMQVRVLGPWSRSSFAVRCWELIHQDRQRPQWKCRQCKTSELQDDVVRDSHHRPSQSKWLWWMRLCHRCFVTCTVQNIVEDVGKGFPLISSASNTKSSMTINYH